MQHQVIIAFILSNLFVTTQAIHKELYTTNAICRRKYCVNPIFPGLEDLHRLDGVKWVSAKLSKTAPTMNFCRGAINYNPALPLGSVQMSLAEVVKKQEQAAITMYTYHLSGMGLEFWDHTKPEYDDDDCIKAVWRMTCYTYFPKAQVGTKEGQESAYLRPCQSSCYNYIRACQVECCDESVQCVFEHEKQLSSTKRITQTGYIQTDGPSSVCTGGARRGHGMPFWIILICIMFSVFNMGDAASFDAPSFSTFSIAATRCWAMLKTLSMGLIVALAFVLQGCDSDVPSHVVGNWRGEKDYIIHFEFVPPEGSAKDAKLNSCSFPHLAQTLQCSGRGICRAWDADDLANPLAFCECDRDWADPECRTLRHSQIKAYLLSLFVGFLGADLFYLGYPILGACKLASFGGLGFWWIIDIVRIGSAPVYADRYRTAADLPHWAFVLTTVTFACLVGFTCVGIAALKHRRRKRKDVLTLQAEEESRRMGDLPEHQIHDHRHHHHKLHVPAGNPPSGPSGPFMQRM